MLLRHSNKQSRDANTKMLSRKLLCAESKMNKVKLRWLVSAFVLLSAVHHYNSWLTVSRGIVKRSDGQT